MNDVICGLSPNDLQTWQLRKLTPPVLVSCISDDIRVEGVLCERLEEPTAELITALKANTFNFNDYILLKNSYNDFVRNYRTPIKTISGWNAGRELQRGEVIRWDWLLDENKVNEVYRWLNNEHTEFNFGSDKLGWLFTKPELTEKVIEYFLGRNNSSGLRDILQFLPEPHISRHGERLMSLGLRYDKNIIPWSLGNVAATDEMIVKSLRIISNKTSFRGLPREINAPLQKKHFASLPPVMRLKALETIMIECYTVNFVDIKEQEDLNHLLFGTSLNYNYRVSRVVSLFNKKFKPKQEQK